MAQPPLSVSIQKLESELRAKLFARESSGVVLTQATVPFWFKPANSWFEASS